MIKLIKLTMFLFIFISNASAQVIKDGTYKFTMAFTEYATRNLDTTCTVVIKGRYITVLHDGNQSIKGKKGDIINQGILMKHKRTRKFIIGSSEKDKLAEEIGGCTDDPNIVDIEKKIFWTC